MKINSFKVNGFGKLKNKQVELKDGINIIYGENESGKSSMLKFISSMFYGASKNKNGKEISDFDKYKPWNIEEFSGKIDYTLDNGENFEVFREFKKKNPLIYNSQKEDISKKFNIDKTKGIEFFMQQTGIDEETFYSTAITEQEGIKLSKSSQASIVQKISNLISSGDDNISYKKSLERINKSQNEEVGTERTSQRPINIVENKINKLIQEKSELEIYKESIYDNSSERESLKLEDEEIKKEFLKEVKIKQDCNKLKSVEITVSKKLEDEYNKKIEELNNKILEDDSAEGNSLKGYYIALIIFVITAIAIIILSNLNPIAFTSLIPVVLIGIKIIIQKRKENSGEDEFKIISQIDLLRKNKEEQQSVIEDKSERLRQEIEKERQELISKYMGNIDIGYIEETLSQTDEDIVKEIDMKESRINTLKFRLQTMESSNRDIVSKLDNLSKIEEELQDAEEEREELISLNNSYNIAKECLENAYMQVKENISPKFTKNLCDIISRISSNRYTNIVLNDNEDLTVELENGNYIPVSRLSIGTIDQMYLSLRLSALEEISTETMPIILDEAFAYFDDERLSNILKYIKSNFSNNQIIIFTCSNREIQILEKLNIEYNLINLEK